MIFKYREQLCIVISTIVIMYVVLFRFHKKERIICKSIIFLLTLLNSNSEAELYVYSRDFV